MRDPVFRINFQRTQPEFLRLVKPAAKTVDLAEAIVCSGQPGVIFQSLIVVHLRPVQITHILVCTAQVIPGIGEIGEIYQGPCSNAG